jgi:hypothetical protein
MEKTFSIKQIDESTIKVDRNGFSDHELIAILKYAIDITKLRIDKSKKVEISVDDEINGWKKVQLNPSE